jgi:hypothetical protein
MKKSLLILIFSFSSSLIFSQKNFDDFIGYWESEGTSTNIVVWKDKFGNPQIVDFDTKDGEVLEILGMWFENNILYVNTNTKNNWKVYGSYMLINDREIRFKYKNKDSEGQLIFTKVK